MILDIIYKAWQVFNSFLLFIIILFIGFIIGKLIGLFVYRTMKELDIKKVLKKLGIKNFNHFLFGKLVSYFVYLLSIFIALKTVRLDRLVVYVILIIAFLIILMALIINIINYIPNIIGANKLKNKLKVGQKVNINGIKGEVNKIGADVELTDVNGDTIHLPAKYVKQYK